MLLYLFVLNGQPTARTELHRAQAALEDHLRDRRDVSDVWWSNDNPYIPRVYLYGGSHSDYEADVAAGVDPQSSWEEQDQLIWPLELDEPPQVPVTLTELPGVTMTLSVVKSDDRTKTEMTRVVPQTEWDRWVRPGAGPLLPLHIFAVEAAQAIGDKLSKKEGP